MVEVGGLAGGLKEAGKLEVNLGQAKLFDGFGELGLVKDGVAGEFVVGDEVLDLGVGLRVVLPGDRAVGEAGGGGGEPGAVALDDAAALATEDDGAAPAGGGEDLGEELELVLGVGVRIARMGLERGEGEELVIGAVDGGGHGVFSRNSETQNQLKG